YLALGIDLYIYLHTLSLHYALPILVNRVELNDRVDHRVIQEPLDREDDPGAVHQEPTDHSHQLADIRDEEPQPGHGQVDPQVQDELQEVDRDDQQPADPGQLVGRDEHDHKQHDADRVLHLQHVPELGREREGSSRERERPDHGSPGEESARSLADAPHRRTEHEDAYHDVGREVVHIPRHV